MAILPDSDRIRVWKGLMRFWSNIRDILPNITKADLKAAVDAADTWVDDNSASYNSALPEPFRSNATVSQKSLLLVAVVLIRYNLEMLKRSFGEVD